MPLNEMCHLFKQQNEMLMNQQLKFDINKKKPLSVMSV